MPSNFRINAKNFFLTYPHCGIALENFVFDSDKYLIAKELHQDGLPHIHCYLHYEVKRNIKSERHFDVQGFHPNIQAARSISGVLAYVRKGGEFITNMTEQELNKGEINSKRTILALNILQEGSLTPKLIKANPEVIFMNYENTRKWLEVLKQDDQRPEAPKEKKRHIWLYGESNTGKTITLRKWRDRRKTFEIPTNNDWRGAENAELLWFDEFKGQLTVQQLNRICDGDCSLNTKGGSTHIWYPQVVIVSNYSIKDCYSNLDDSILYTIRNRFIEYESPLQYRL